MQKTRPMLSTLRIAIAIGFCTLGATSAAAATITVGPTGTYPTIQQGINAANAGDTVLVQPGTYPENLSIINPIILESSACVGKSATSGCNALTIIDGQGLGSVIVVSNIPSLKTVIQGFTLTNGRSGSSGSNAGVELDTAGAIILNNTFSANAAALSVNAGAVDFNSNTVSDVIPNGSLCSSANGLYLTGTNTLVLDNFGLVASTTINGNTFSGGSKCTGGIGIIDQQGSNTIINFNQISGQNQAIEVFGNNALTYIYDNLITGNTNGGVYINHLSNSPSVDPADTFLLNNTIVNNLSAAKGLVGAAGPAEVYVSGSYSKVELVNNILSTNSNTNPVLDCAGSPPSSNAVTPIILDHNLFYNSGAFSKLGTNGCPITVGTFGNINANPNFVSSTNFQLAGGSPAIDAGNNSGYTVLPVASDILGNARVGNGIVDMGAYEVPALTTSFSTIAATSSSYYLVSGNNFTITAQLANTTNSGTINPAGQHMDFFRVDPSGTTSGVSASTDANGSGFLPETATAPGVYAFTNSYPGGAYPAAQSIVQYVYVANPLAVTTIGLTSNINPSLVGQNVTFTVTSSATDGTHPTPVVLADNGTTLATLTIPASGSITYSTSTLALGSHPMTATFAGDSTHTSGVASLTQLVGNFTATTTALSSSVNPSFFTQSVTFTAHVASASGVPTGSIAFLDGGTQLGAAVTVDASGNATYTTKTFTVGSHSLTANFTATGSYANSSGTLTQVVNNDPTQSVLTVTPSPATYGSNVTLSAQVSILPPYNTGGLPTGTVTFFDGATSLGTATLNATGVAAFVVSTLSAGSHTIGCTYNGTTGLATSTCNQVGVTITQAATSTAVSSSSNPSPAYAPLTFTVKSTSNGQPLAAANITLTITPTGGTAASYPLTTDATGTASYAFTGFPAGTYLVAATYPATTNYSTSTNSLTQIVTVNATTISLAATPNPGIQNNPVALGATVFASAGLVGPSGSVTFLDGATPLGTVTLSPTPGKASTAVLTTSTLTPGVHTISASYTPSDPSFSASGPVTISLTILPQDFTLTANPPSISIQTQHHGTMPLTLTSIGGFPAPVSLSCGALPQYVTCELASTTVTLNATTPTTVNVTFDTDALLNFAQARPAPRSGHTATLAVFATLLPFLLFARRRRLRHLLPLLLLACASLSLTACSGLYPGHTPPGTYIIPITATGTAPGSTGPTTHTLNITLTVTP